MFKLKMILKIQKVIQKHFNEAFRTQSNIYDGFFEKIVKE